MDLLSKRIVEQVLEKVQARSAEKIAKGVMSKDTEEAISESTATMNRMREAMQDVVAKTISERTPDNIPSRISEPVLEGAPEKPEKGSREPYELEVDTIGNEALDRNGMRLVDVTDTEQGKLSNEEALYEMGKQIREETIKTEGLMSPTDSGADGVQPTDGKVWLSSQLDTILETEGGFQNDKEDDGNYVDGKLIGTNKGITPAALAEYRGVNPSTITVEDIKGITDKEAREIYEQNYYYKTKINELPENIQASVFDMNINAGPNAIKILQRLAGVKDDGIIGPQTIKAVQEANITLDQYADARIKYYKQVVKNDPDKKKYLKGWINRANKYREA